MMTTPSGSPQPHGFVVPVPDTVDDDAADPAQSPDREDDESARAEALGFADPEDAPSSTAGTQNAHGSEDDEGDRQAAAEHDQRPL